MKNIFLLIIWIVIGLLALFSPEISKLQYGCMWVMLILSLIDRNI